MKENQCETNCSIHESTNTHTGDSSSNTCGCECGCETTNNNDNCSCCSTDPVNAAKSLLESSFFAALKEVHVEKLKKLIEKEWGSTIDKGVELTFRVMEKQWQSSISKSVANKEFYSELEKIFASGKPTSK